MTKSPALLDTEGRQKRERRLLVRHLQEAGASRGEARRMVRNLTTSEVRRLLPLRLRIQAWLT